MFRKTKICTSLMLAFGGGLALGALPAFGQQQLEKVEITGSAIKRIESEGAVPITVLNQEDIKKSGATTITDLIQSLPSMQGFVAASASVNGGGGGGTTAALHSLPSKYTLVLLDGQRVAPLALGVSAGGGFGVNLESIPLAAVERVEILTDGASALYGSDAISGVVNFILKKNKTDGDVELTYNQPQHSGGSSWNASLTKGFGNLDSDGFNVLVSLSHDEQKSLAALQRPFSATGAYFPFSVNGTQYIFNARTSNTEPANLTFSARPKGSTTDTPYSAYSLNPYYTKNGNCGSPLAGALTDPAVLGATGVSCRFNYAATVQDIPSSIRDSALIKGSLKLGDSATLWSELALTDYRMRAQYAPAAQPLVVSPTKLPALYDNYILPYLDANGLEIKDGSGKAGYRSVSLGGRADNYETMARHFAFGVEGNLKGWDYNASLTLSNTKFTDTAAGGYSDFDQFSAAIASGAYDPVLGTGQSSLNSAILKTQFEKVNSTVNTLHLGVQHDLFDLPGGTSVLALGGDYSTTHYTAGYDNLYLTQSGFSTQPLSADYPVGGSYGQIPFDAGRSNYGVFGEWYLPVVKQFDVTVSARYDSYSKTHSKYVFSTELDPDTGLYNQIGDADLGNKFSSATGKVSLRYTPVESVLLRGSYGTGFKAPNISDIAGALTFGGSTSGTYACPFPGSAGCIPGSAQYDLVAGPNGLSGDAGLKPEKSKQWTLGFRVEPVKGFLAGLDLWNVKIKDQVLSSGIAEQVGFANPQQYANLFINPYQDPAGFTTIAFQQVPFNGGEAQYRGIDWDVSFRTKLSFGDLTAQWTGTQMLKQQYNFGPGLPFNTDLATFGPDQAVVFRTITNFSLSLQTGSFLNTLTAHYRSGYTDAGYSADDGVVFLANPDGSLGDSVGISGVHVPSYTTFDWQTRFTYNKALQFTVGVKNVADRDPPRSLQSGGGGNQVGYDGRYADPIGRQYYLTAHYTF